MARVPRPVRRALLALGALAATAFALAVAAPNARAASGLQYGLTDDAWLLNGPGTLASRLSTLESLGVPVVRFTLVWNAISPSKPAQPTDPTDPAYNWTQQDAVIDGLRAHGISVVLQLVGTPVWANGGKPSNYAPTSTSSFRDFATAAATHYPWVKRWLIWNEPNQVRWLRPTKPSIYVTRLLNPAYAAIHAAIPGAQVAGGATAPRGATGGVAPVTWIAGMHAAHARLDAYAHNPYPLDPKSESPFTGGCKYCQTITMATIRRLLGLVTKDFGHARIWLTEYGYQTDPPDRILGVSPTLQARYIGEGLYQAYRTPRVDLLFQFLYQDEPSLDRFQSGLVTRSGTKKPSYAAYELPLAELSRSGTTTTLWGQVRAPDALGTTAVLERKVGAGWVRLATLTPSSRGYFRWRGTLPAHTWVRIRAGDVTGAQISIR